MTRTSLQLRYRTLTREILVKTNVSPVRNHYISYVNTCNLTFCLFFHYIVCYYNTVDDMNHVDSKQHMQNISELKWSKCIDVILTTVIFINILSRPTMENTGGCNSVNITTSSN